MLLLETDSGQIPLFQPDRFALAEMTARSFDGCKISLKGIIGDYVPPDYTLLDSGIRGKMFENGSSIIVELFTP